ncbi:peptide ABC transporter ATP-binding protein [Solibacillus silvestris]|nr:ABC transporter ATP-binding protein [Solibacillus silvestris]OBW55863.1 peptide ABC transporter ATP-binding protein [Solibacillus silvestris]
MTLITLTNIKKDFGKNESLTHALKDINFKVKEGEMIAITGTSGSGKTTLLNIIGCLDQPSLGDYHLLGQQISQKSGKEMAVLRNKFFGFVMQDFALVDYYTVLQNIKLPLLYTTDKRLKQIRTNTILPLLKSLGIEDKANVKAGLLSGGQKQRVAIARALINDPKVILADEPTGALDQKTSLEIIQLLKELNRKGKTIIIITHDPAIAAHCSRIIELQDGFITNDIMNT